MSTEPENFTKNFTKKINGLFIDPKIFTFPFSCECTGECCHYGVYTELREYDKILEIKDQILPLFDDTQTKDLTKWFEPPEEDEDFEAGVAIGTEVNNSKCTFLDGNGLCVLQKLALMKGEHKWKYKPIYCVLFPLTIYEKSLTIDDDHVLRLKSCNKNNHNGTTIFEHCKEEIKYFLGEEGFSELENYRDEYLNDIKIGEKEDVTK